MINQYTKDSKKFFSLLLILLIFLLVSILIVHFQVKERIIHANSVQQLEKSSFYLDLSHAAKVDEIEELKFEPFDRSIALGFQYHPIWIQLKVKAHDQPVVISISPSVLDEIVLFEKKADGWATRVTGDKYPKNFREVADSNFHFIISPDRKESKTYFIKVTTSSLSNINVTIEDIANTITLNEKEDTINGINLGSLITFMLICLVGFILNTSGLSASLLLYSVTSVLFILSFNGGLLGLLPDHLSPINDTIYKALLISKVGVSHLLSYFLIKKIEGPRWYLRITLFCVPVYFVMLMLVSSPFYLISMFWFIKFAIFLQVINLIAVWYSKEKEIKPSILLGYITMMALAAIFQSNVVIQSSFITAAQLLSINTTVTSLIFLMLYLKLSLNERKKTTLMAAEINANEKSIKSNGLLFDMLSHEIKNAVSVINLGAESLKDSIDDDDDDDDAKLRRKLALKKRTSNIKASASNITAILQRCLRLNEIEDGRVKIKPISFDLGELLNEVSQDLDEKNQISDTKIRMALASPVRLNQDYFLFKLMLSNLIENACKYAIPGTEVGVQVEKKLTHQGESLVVRISNETSVGFPDESKLFERYYRSENAHRMTGSGVGLVLVKKLAQIFEGDVHYSHDDRYVIFTVEVKL